MDFTITDEQQGLVSSLRDVLAREAPRSLLRDVVEGRGDGRSLWDTAVGLGWPALTVPEAYGGIGLSPVELVLAFEELGRAAAPGPFLGTMSQFVPAILELGSDEQRDRWLPAVATGELTGSFAVAEDGRWDVVTPRCEAKPDGDGFRLDGTKTHVVDAHTADELVVTATVEGAPGAFVVPAKDVRSEPTPGLDVSRPVGTIHLDGVHVTADRRLTGTSDVAAGIERALEVATVALAAETLGTCQTIFDLTVDYARVREQFDRPIGSFQALKHQFADQYVLLERTRAVVSFAAMTLAEDDPRRAMGAAMAKAAAGDAQRRIVAGGIQLHGGIAYTWEHDIQLLVKRAMVGDALLGNAPTQRQRIADLLELPRVRAA